MATPSLNNFFGANAQYLTADTQITATTNAPVLVIYPADFTSEGLDDAGSFSIPERLAAALIKKMYGWLASDTTEDPGVEIAAPTKTFTTRNAESRIAWLYYVTFFTPDSTSAQPDPDEIPQTGAN